MFLHQGDMVRCGEIWGDLGSCGEMWGDVVRCGEIWGDMGAAFSCFFISSLM